MKCMIVDDNQNSLDLCKRHVLHVRGCEPKPFSSPVEALQYLKTNSVDLIILDINIEQMSGIAFIEAVKNIEFESEPAIMVCSEESNSEIILQLMGMGVIGYVVKPYEGGTLKKQIRHIRNHTRPELIPATEMWNFSSTC